MRKFTAFCLVFLLLLSSLLVIGPGSQQAAAAPPASYLHSDFDDGTLQGWDWGVVSTTFSTSGSYCIGPNGANYFPGRTFSAITTDFKLSFALYYPANAGANINRSMGTIKFSGGTQEFLGYTVGDNITLYVPASGGDVVLTTIQPNVVHHIDAIFRQGCKTVSFTIDGVNYGTQTIHSTSVSANGLEFLGENEYENSGTLYRTYDFYYDTIDIVPYGWPPALTSTPATTSNVGAFYVYQPTTNETSTITVPTLPYWATFTSGVVYGIPPVEGSYAFGLHAVATIGTWDMDYYWNVTVGPYIPPVNNITNVTAIDNSTNTFTNNTFGIGSPIAYANTIEETTLGTKSYFVSHPRWINNYTADYNGTLFIKMDFEKAKYVDASSVRVVDTVANRELDEDEFLVVDNVVIVGHVSVNKSAQATYDVLFLLNYDSVAGFDPTASLLNVGGIPVSAILLGWLLICIVGGFCIADRMADGRWSMWKVGLWMTIFSIVAFASLLSYNGAV